MAISGWLAPVHGWAQAPVERLLTTNCGLIISGQVLDHETRQPLPGATVVLLRADGSPTGAATTTDAFGNYHLHDLCAGLYRVRFLFVGYVEEVDEVKLNRPMVISPQLHFDAVQLQSAIVRATRPTESAPQVSTALSANDQRSTRGQTLGEALTRISGVTAITTGPSIYKPMIHGLHSNRITLLNNGVRQEGQQWGQEHGPEIDPFVASELSVVKGAATVRYGSDAIGGVVLLKPAPLRDSAGIGGAVHLVGASNNRMGAASATLDGNSRRWPALRGRVQGTVRRAGTTRTPDYYLSNSGFAEADYSAAVGWQQDRWGVEAFGSRFHTKLGILTASHVGNLTDLRRAFEAPRPLVTGGFSYVVGRPYQLITHDLLKLSAHWQPIGRGRIELTVAHQTDLRDEYDRFPPRNDALAARNLPELSYQNRTTTADLTWDHPAWAGGAFTGTIGLSGTRQGNTFSGRYFIPYYTNQVGGVFAIERWVRGRWLLEAGARLDYRALLVKRALGTAADYRVQRDQFRYLTPALSAGAVLDAGPHLTTRLSATLSQRAPAPNERFSQGVHNGQYEEGHDLTLAPGEAPLRPETARTASLTATWHHNPRLNGELTAYVTQISGYIYSTPILPPVLTIRGPFPSYRFLQTDARLAGFDATARYTLPPHWEVLAKAAIVRARDTRAHDFLIFQPADRAELAVRRAFGPAQPAAGHHLAGTYAQVSGQAVARQTRVSANYDSLDYQQPPAGYWLLGAEIGTTVTAFHQPLDLSVAGTNLLNRRYRDYLNRFRYFADEQGRNLTVRLSARF